MNYKVLYRKYRPSDFNEIVGQEHIKKILVNSIINNKIAHAYIFTGPRGTGKTSTAKIFAKTLNCLDNQDGISCNKCSNCIDFKNNPDIIELDAASNNGVDNIREIIENLEIAPTNSKYKIYIIDEVHMLTSSAWNAFLKTLEEPPKNIIFILATTDIQKVPITVLSRCQRFDFTRIERNLIFDNLKRICDTEYIQYEESALDEITYLSDGCMRDALSILDQLSKVSDYINNEVIRDNYGSVSNEEINQLYFSIINNDLDSLQNVLNLIKESGIDVKILIDKILDNFINKAVEMKRKNISNNVFNHLKSLIENLNQLYSKISITNNGFLLLNLELISFINNEENSLSSREINQILSKNIVEENLKIEEVINKKESYYKMSDSFVNIRVNNSFVNCNKIYKQEFLKKWDTFKEYVNKYMIKELFSLMPAVPMVCSSEYALLVIKSESLKIVGNNKLYELENYFNSFSKTNYKFIFQSQKDWDQLMRNYDKTKVYDYKEEDDYINSNADSFKLAESMFGNDNINIE